MITVDMRAAAGEPLSPRVIQLYCNCSCNYCICNYNPCFRTYVFGPRNIFCYFSMASFAARWPPRAAWTVDECARFAALKEFELLRLLSTDKKGRWRRLVVWASLSHIPNRIHLQALPQAGE